MTRIIGGRAGGRALVTPRGSATRPTSDRVREALFSILVARDLIAGARVLDLYAGSGALGLEAASRGAATVTLVEEHRATARLIASNATALGLRADVVTATVRGFAGARLETRARTRFSAARRGERPTTWCLRIRPTRSPRRT